MLKMEVLNSGIWGIVMDPAASAQTRISAVREARMLNVAIVNTLFDSGLLSSKLDAADLQTLRENKEAPIQYAEGFIRFMRGLGLIDQEKNSDDSVAKG